MACHLMLNWLYTMVVHHLCTEFTILYWRCKWLCTIVPRVHNALLVVAFVDSEYPRKKN